MPKPADVGVIVGRFQVHRLHDAHLDLIRTVSESHRNTLIVLGLSPVRVSHRNPLDFESRKQMLLEAFPSSTVLYLKDEPSDELWSKKLDGLISDYVSPAQSVVLYGGRDSFIARYHGKIPTQELEPTTYTSGSEMRKSISKAVRGTEDFRAGVIWASANGYPRIFPTVDVAVRREDGACLMVRKPNETLWRFPGGFVSPTDASLEIAARREVSEETGVEIANLVYRGSFRVDDWRYRHESDQIMTTLFTAQYVFGPVRPADDVAEAKWWSRLPSPLEIVSEHDPLLAALTEVW